MDVTALTTVGGVTISAVSAYLGLKAHRLPSERNVRKEIEDRLRGKHEIPKPLAARRHDEIDWNGDFYFTVENVKVYEDKKRRKWLPRHGFTGITILELEFHEREVPDEERLYGSFLGDHGLFGIMNKHIDDPHRLTIRVDTADINTVCGHVIGTFKRKVMEIEFKKDNPEVDEDWLTHQRNTFLGYKNGNLYDILNERVALGLLHIKGQKPPDNIPPKTTEPTE